MISKPIHVIGGGLAGCEAAWQLARRNHDVLLYDMKPLRFSPAHQSPHLAELVCSNSLRSNVPESAAGLLKEEMRALNSLIMEAADKTAVPAGKALAVDRNAFSLYIEEKLTLQKSLEVVHKEVITIPEDAVTIIATGPLTSDALSTQIASLTGREHLAFYDAIAPIVEADSIDYSLVFRASRYDHADGDYLNCPMTEEEYRHFWEALISGAEVPLRNFEKALYFEGCLPVEIMAKRGIQTLRFGPMKPVGLINPKTGRQPFAVVQLRQENREATLFSMVGFQTKLTWPEQRRILRTIPGLERAEFARYGSIHRNTFINAPALLRNTLQLRTRSNIFFAGQITGVEGYVESAAMGLLAGLSVSHHMEGRAMAPPPHTTALGALSHYLAHGNPENFQPMNINFGLFHPLAGHIPKKERGMHYARRSLVSLKTWMQELNP